jgi:type IV pilus assembly protein PilM
MNCTGHKHVKLKNAVVDWERVFKTGQKPQVFGLDIGSSAIKIVQLHKNNGDYVVTAAGIAYVDKETEGNGSKESHISKAIRNCLHSAKVQTKLAVCGVCGAETVIRPFMFPMLLPEEVEGAVLLEAKQVCPFNSDDGVVDYQVIKSDKKEISGILAVATNRLIIEKARFVKNAALNNVLMDVDGLSLLNCLRICQKDENDRTAAILNIGSSYATLAMISDDNLPFVRDLNYAGKAIVENIASKNNVSPRDVEKVLFGGENPDKVQFDVHENLKTACHKLISDVTETLCYDAVRRKSEIVKKVFLCGGFSLIEGVADLLNNQLPVATELWNPFEKIGFDESLHCADILRKKGPALAVAAGLALRAI